jgi:hypothetical protein
MSSDLRVCRGGLFADRKMFKRPDLLSLAVSSIACGGVENDVLRERLEGGVGEVDRS